MHKNVILTWYISFMCGCNVRGVWVADTHTMKFSVPKKWVMNIDWFFAQTLEQSLLLLPLSKMQMPEGWRRKLALNLKFAFAQHMVSSPSFHISQLVKSRLCHFHIFPFILTLKASCCIFITASSKVLHSCTLEIRPINGDLGPFKWSQTLIISVLLMKQGKKWPIVKKLQNKIFWGRMRQSRIKAST